VTLATCDTNATNLHDFAFANDQHRRRVALMKARRSKYLSFAPGGGISTVVLIPALLFSAVVSVGLGAEADKKAEPPASTPAGQYDALVNEYQKAQQDFFKVYNAAKTDEEREKLSGKYPQPQAYSPRFLDLARKNPKDPVAFNALVWVVTNDRYGQQVNDTLEVLLRDHIENEKLGQVAQSMVYSNAREPAKTLESIIEKSPHREVKGTATYSLGLVRRGEQKDAEAEKLFEQVIEKFGDVEGGFRGTLADAARGQLFEIRNLAIGKVAPDIEGEDVDGKSFKLSDYRGKVVVIDFWGDW
jgi:AhpC/TSA family protein